MRQEIGFELSSNGYILDTSPQRLGWLAPSDPAEPLPTLRERYSQNGYLWLKGLLEREKVLELRRRYFGALVHSGLVRSDFDPMEGIFFKEDYNRDAVHKTQMAFVRSAAYESFCLAEPIWKFYEAFLEGDPYLHKRKIIRHTKPQDPACTGAHYDLVYLRGGTDHICTSWIPIGDTPFEMGGLVYLEGSHAWSRQMEAEYRQKAADLSPQEQVSAYNRYMDKTGWMTKDIPSLAEKLNTHWLAANYEAGDMVVHSPYMVHASTVNEDTAGRMRLSTDIRYQRVQDEIDARWQNHWTLDDML